VPGAGALVNTTVRPRGTSQGVPGRKRRDFPSRPSRRAARGRATGAASLSCRNTPPVRTALRLPARAGRHAQELGRAEGPSLDPAGQAARRATSKITPSNTQISRGRSAGAVRRRHGSALDRGTWEPLGDPPPAVPAGPAEVPPARREAEGRVALIRMHGQDAEDGKNWLLIKERDEFARTRASSSRSRRRRRRASAPAAPWMRSRPPETASGKAIDLPAARRRLPVAAPRKRKAGAATALTRATCRGCARRAAPRRRRPSCPSSPRWSAGCRTGTLAARDEVRTATAWWCVKDGDSVRLISRNGKDWTGAVPGGRRGGGEAPRVPGRLDGEIVVLNDDGTTDFQALQNVLRNGRHARLVYFCSTCRTAWILTCGACRCTNATGAAPRRRTGRRDRSVHASTSRDRGPVVFAQACRLKMEGLVSKRIDSGPTNPGARAPGSRPSARAARSSSSAATPIRPARAAGSGPSCWASTTTRASCAIAERWARDSPRRPCATSSVLCGAARALPRRSPICPAGVPAGPLGRTGTRRRDRVQRVTDEGILRHPSYQGLREDKDPRTVKREEPATGTLPREPDPAPAARARPKARGSGLEFGADPAAAGRDAAAARTGRQPTEVAGVRLTNPQRVMYPDQNVRSSRWRNTTSRSLTGSCRTWRAGR